MKAIRINQPGDVEIFETGKPVPKKGEALLKLLYGGICGSDLGTYRGTFAYASYPRIPGHEFSAQIVEIGENDRGLKKGMIVTCNPYFNCGKCYSCERGLLNCCEHNETMARSAMALSWNTSRCRLNGFMTARASRRSSWLSLNRFASATMVPAVRISKRARRSWSSALVRLAYWQLLQPRPLVQRSTSRISQRKNWLMRSRALTFLARS